MGQISILALYTDTKTILKSCGIENYINEASFLIEAITGIKKFELPIKGQLIATNEQTVKLKSFIERRQQGEPLQYILGRWEFYGLPFYVGDGVLVPRQDTETLVEDTLQRLKNIKSPVICDLCSGSGCIAITLSKELLTKKVFAVEKSEKALHYLEKNINLNNAGATVISGDVTDKEIAHSFEKVDCIVSNPPYLTKTDMESLQKEVTFEPKMALKGGDDGLYFYRKITDVWKDRIKKGGFIAYEIGINQHEDVKNILLDNGFKDIFMTKDLCSVIRVVGGYR